MTDDIKRAPWVAIIGLLTLFMVPSITGGFFIGRLSSDVEAIISTSSIEDGELREQMSADVVSIKRAIVTEISSVKESFHNQLALHTAMTEVNSYTTEAALAHNAKDNERYYEVIDRIKDIENNCSSTNSRLTRLEEKNEVLR